MKHYFEVVISEANGSVGAVFNGAIPVAGDITNVRLNYLREINFISLPDTDVTVDILTGDPEEGGVGTIFANPLHRPKILDSAYSGEANAAAFPVEVVLNQTIQIYLMNLPPGGMPAPLSVVIDIEDGVEGGSTLPEGDLNAETNVLEKIQGRTVTIEEDAPSPISDMFDAVNNTIWGAYSSGNVFSDLPTAQWEITGGYLGRLDIAEEFTVRNRIPFQMEDGDYIVVNIGGMQFNNNCYVRLLNTNTGANNGNRTDYFTVRASSNSAGTSGTLHWDRFISGGFNAGADIVSGGFNTWQFIRLERIGADLVVSYSANGSSYTPGYTDEDSAIFGANTYLEFASYYERLRIYSVVSNIDAVTLAPKSVLWFDESLPAIVPASIPELREELGIGDHDFVGDYEAARDS